jgi:hypothetical protein
MADWKGVVALFEQIARKAPEQLLSNARPPPMPEPPDAHTRGPLRRAERQNVGKTIIKCFGGRYQIERSGIDGL